MEEFEPNPIKRHPEQCADEVFVGNTGNDLPEYTKILKTARVGNIAYDIHGKKIEASRGIRPLFVGVKDFNEYDRIMLSRSQPRRTE